MTTLLIKARKFSDLAPQKALYSYEKMENAEKCLKLTQKKPKKQN